MKTTKHFCLMILIIAMQIVSTNIVNAQFEETAKWVPETANAIVMVRADEILRSQLAVKENWKADRMKAFNSGASFLPPSTKQLLMAFQLDFEYMESIWEVAIFEKTGAKIDILPVSKLVGGNLEKVADLDAVLLPNDTYIVKIDDRTLGSRSPANRQATARWLRTRKVASMNLSDYLTKAVKFADDNADFIVAFDLRDVIHHDFIVKRLEESGIVDKAQIDDVAKTISTVKGLTLGITINDKITGAIKIDFSGSPANIGPDIGKKLLLLALKKHGVMIEDFEKWDMKVNGDQLLMMGPLTRMGLRQISVLIEQPLAPDFHGDSGSQSEVDMKTRSMQYFGSIQTLIKELRHKDFKAMTTYAKFFDKYSRQIDNLSVLNVDPVVLSYGSYVSDSFRSVQAGLLDVNLGKVRDRQTYEAGTANYHGRGSYTNYYGYTSRFGWGGGGYNSNLRNRQRVTGEARLKGEIGAKEIMRDVDTHTAEVRRQMSEKYQVDF